MLVGSRRPGYRLSEVLDTEREGHVAREFARRHPRIVWLADYRRYQPGHAFARRSETEPVCVHASHTELLEELSAAVKTKRAGLP